MSLEPISPAMLEVRAVEIEQAKLTNRDQIGRLMRQAASTILALQRREKEMDARMDRLEQELAAVLAERGES